MSIVPLTGGFGNQLFQFAFALYLNEVKGHQVSLDITLGNPRLVGNKAAILELGFKHNPMDIFSKKSILKNIYTKAFGWNLVRGLDANRRNSLKSLFFKFLSYLLFGVRYGSPLSIKTSKNLGLDSTIVDSRLGLYIGYFQTYVYASDDKVRAILQSVKPANLSEYFYCERKRLRSKSLVLHVRMTDYLLESKFGIPSPNYYREAIEKIRQNREFESLYIVSDDIVGAHNHLKEIQFDIPVNYLDQSRLTDLEVWELMRNFSGYVISNSTFAWWAAFLRYDSDAPVCAPRPWFSGMEDPVELLPREWLKVNSQ